MSKWNTISRNGTYTYSANGNILSKTGIDYYEYGSTQKPHAVTAVDNFDGWIDDSIQYISYNSWGKLEDLFSVRDGDVYHYSIEYGPDLQRVRSSLYRNGQPLYSKLYWDDYEEKTENNTTYLYWYVNGGEGLAGIMMGNAQNGSWSRNLVAITDHLGSIMALMDNYDTYYSCSYDAWGNRTIGMESTPVFDRGFCGHEHIDEIGLINMNGRMYDPKLGRFLSPDPYIQAPTDPQNFNRYSYCLNNPLKYTDPDGEFWHIVIGALIGGFTNWASNGFKDGWEGFKYWGIGALAGGVGVGVGAGISSSLAGGSFGAGFLGSKAAMSSASCFISGAAIGSGAGFSGGVITGLGNGFMNKESFKDALWNGTKSGLIGGLSGAFLGGALGGIDAYLNDRNFWNGKLPQSNNALENEIWGEISIKARGTGPGSSSLDGHSWIELTDSKGETTSFGTWGNQGEQEFFINFENDLGSHYDAIQTKTITNAQRLRFDKFINSSTKNQKWSIFRNCSYFSSKAFYYTTGENVMAHPFGIPIYTPSWLTRTITH